MTEMVLCPDGEQKGIKVALQCINNGSILLGKSEYIVYIRLIRSLS